MNKRYLINDQIEFWPEENKLVSGRQPGVSAQLTTPASRCLVLLLDAAPQILSQQVFFEKVWEDMGMYVPPNTLYQNISIIRRALKTVCNDDSNIIVTLPRQGFRIAEDVTISVLESDPEDVHVPAFRSDDPVSEPAENDAPDNDAVIVGTSEVLPVSPPARKIVRGAGRRYVVGGVLFATLIAAVSGGYFYQQDKQELWFHSYRQLPDENGCKFFLNSDGMTDAGGIKLVKPVFVCQQYPWNYITSYRHVPVLSVVSCNKPLDGSENKLGCVSIFLRDFK